MEYNRNEKKTGNIRISEQDGNKYIGFLENSYEDMKEKIKMYEEKQDALDTRIKELLSEKKDLVDENNHQESEINRLKGVCLNLQTEMTATKMSEWCLKDPEELYEIEQGINERKTQKKEIERKEKVITTLQAKNKHLYNKVNFLYGKHKMIRQVLNSETMVVHPWVNDYGYKKEPKKLDNPTNFNMSLGDCGGFGMFEESIESYSDDEGIFNNLDEIVTL